VAVTTFISSFHHHFWAARHMKEIGDEIRGADPGEDEVFRAGHDIG